jgi:hypothetical protein
LDNSGLDNSDLLISVTERKLGPAPRHLDRAERLFLLRCTWDALQCRLTSDKLYLVYESRKRLLREGNVALGCIVQANDELFSPGDYDRPANVIYCSDRTIPNLVDALCECAQRLFALKNTEPDQADERQLAERITDEYRREMRFSVPKAIAEIEGVTLTTLMVFRKDLPDGYLTNGFFPVLTHPNTPAVLIAPSKFWPDEILRVWEPDED